MSTTTFQASAAETDSADLATLILGDTTLRSPGSDFSFTGFLLLGIPTGTAVPDISRILVTANDGALLWQFGDDSRVLRTGDNYELGIRFETTTIAPLHVLSSAALDIAGATIGTKGDASAEIIMNVFEDGSTLGSLTVREAMTGRRLIDTDNLRGADQWLTHVVINADGGTGTAALVLTDFETSFETVAVPEPHALIIATTWVASLLWLMGRRSRSRVAE